MKKTIALTFATELLLSIVFVVFVSDVSANPYSFHPPPPPQPPAGYRIYSNGTYHGANMRQDGNTYTLTGDINCPIVIERDYVVLDGAGYTVDGTFSGDSSSDEQGDSVGVWLWQRKGVTIKNLTIENFKIGIKFDSDWSSSDKPSVNCYIIGNRLVKNTCGLSLRPTSQCYIIDNYIANNTIATNIGRDNTFRNNSFEGNECTFSNEYYESNDIDVSNTIDGKPIYYLFNQHDMTVPSNAGLVVLWNCRGIRIENLVLKNSGCGIYLLNTNNSTITGNDLSENVYGISLQRCFNNTISSNRIANNAGAGIRMLGSGNNTLSNNTIIGNGIGVDCGEDTIVSNNIVIANQGDGINAGINCNVTGNYVAENGGNGIFFKNLKNSKVIGNAVTLNKGCGIGFGYGPNGIIKENIISKNDVGLWVSNAYYNTIMSNAVTENDAFGIRLEGNHHDNLIYRNNFIDNNKGGIQASILTIWYYPTYPNNYAQSRRFDGAANKWDDDTEGNYWSDLPAGNTTYYINGDNQDNHPLAVPYNVPTVETPQVLHSSSSVVPDITAINILIVAVVLVNTILVMFVALSQKKIQV